MASDLINRSALLAEYDRVHVGEPGGARKLIAEAKAVDAVEVVRCKECKNRYTSNCPMRLNELSHYEGMHGVVGTYMQTVDKATDDGFCHKGVKKDAVD